MDAPQFGQNAITFLLTKKCRMRGPVKSKANEE
jgi:hypothetical protein